IGAGNNVRVSISTTAFGSTPFFSAIESASLREYPAEEIRKFPTSLTSVAAPTSSPKSKRLCPPSPRAVVGRVLWRSVDRQRESRAGERQPPQVFQRWVPRYRCYHVVHAVPQASLPFQATPCSSKDGYHLILIALKTIAHDDAFQGRIIPHNGRDNSPSRHCVNWSRCQLCALSHQRFRFTRSTVVHPERISGIEEIGSHWQTQMAKSDKSDRFTHFFSLLLNTLALKHNVHVMFGTKKSLVLFSFLKPALEAFDMGL